MLRIASRLIGGITFFVVFALKAASFSDQGDYELLFFPKKEKFYEDDEREVLNKSARRVRFFTNTLSEQIVRKTFVEVPNDELVTAFAQEKVDLQDGVLEILKQFKTGRKYASWNANGYYSRDVIDCKLVTLCQMVNFSSFELAKPLVSHKFFNLYDFIRAFDAPICASDITSENLGTLKNVSLHNIVSALLDSPDTKEEIVRGLIEGTVTDSSNSEDGSRFWSLEMQMFGYKLPGKCARFLFEDAKCYLKMCNKKLIEICRRTHFESWDRIDYVALRNNIDMCYAVINELAVRNKISRLQEIAECGSVDLRDSPGMCIFEYCLLASPGTDIYHAKSPQTGEALFEKYMQGLFAMYNDQRFSVISKLSEEEFNQFMSSLLLKENFQNILYVMTFSDEQSRDANVRQLLDWREEVRGRMKRWCAALGVSFSDDNDFTFEQPWDMTNCYDDILAKLSKGLDSIANPTDLLLEVFRTAHVKHEICHAYKSDRVFGKMLFKLAKLGVKPNTPLCPENPEDTRSLLSTYLLMRKPNFVVLRYFSQACNELSEAEAYEEFIKLQHSNEFADQFEQDCVQFETAAKREKKPLENIHTLVKIGHNSMKLNTSLLERLLKHV